MASNKEVLKSGLWYTISNFLIRGIAFITTPIFARILTKDEYGAFSNFSSWVSILAICITLDLESTLIVARFEYKDRIKKYIYSMFLLSSLGVLLFWILFNLIPGYSIKLFDMDIKYINLMMAYVFFLPIINIFTAWERFRYKYKVTIAISGVIAFGSALFGIVFVHTLKNGLLGRTLGFILPTIFLGIIIYLYFIYKERKVDFSMWRYAIPICLPFIPHLLSLNILNSLDRIMITKYCGPRENAFYSIAYSVGAMVTILVSALNNAYSPWLSDNLHKENYVSIKKNSLYYVIFFLWLSIGIMLLSPEVLLFMGGKTYMEAVHCMPPVAMACVCQFIYCMYVNVEQYNKKTIGMAIASVSSAFINFILNLIFIPRYGYIGAAYTTLISYLWLMILHMYLVKRIKLSHIYENIKILGLVFVVLVISLAINWLYDFTIIRYIVTGVYSMVTIYVGIKIIVCFDMVRYLKK